MTQRSAQRPSGRRREQLHEIIFEADTLAGKLFDSLLLFAIAERRGGHARERRLGARGGQPLAAANRVGNHGALHRGVPLRLVSVRYPLRYTLSVFGIIDLRAIRPTRVSLVVPGAQSLLVVRVLRPLRIFRIFKLAEYLQESRVLMQALRASRRKIVVFVLAVTTIVVIVGALMYVVEGEEHGFTSIPVSVYWAVVTLTTVGYGDLAPVTIVGRALSVGVMLIGYAIMLCRPAS